MSFICLFVYETGSNHAHEAGFKLKRAPCPCLLSRCELPCLTRVQGHPWSMKDLFRKTRWGGRGEKERNSCNLVFIINKETAWWSVVAYISSPSIRKAEGESLSLKSAWCIYTVNSRIVSATERNSCLQKTKMKSKTKQNEKPQSNRFLTTILKVIFCIIVTIRNSGVTKLGS